MSISLHIMPKTYLFLILFCYKIDLFSQINLVCGTPINEEYEAVSISYLTIVVPKTALVKNKIKEYNYCDSFQLKIKLSGLNLSLNKYKSLGLKCLKSSKCFNDEKTSMIDSMESGCIKEKLINVSTNLPIELNHVLLDKKEEYAVLDKIKQIKTLYRKKRLFRKDILCILTK